MKVNVTEKIRPISQAATLPKRRESSLGRLPEVILVGAFGLLLIALAFTRPVGEAGRAELMYWLGLLLIILPVSYRLFAAAVSRQERIGLVLFAGIILYLVKVMHSPVMFTFSDEMVHFRNVENILESRRLFGTNSLLAVTAYYPGLETAAAAIASVSGLSIFASGLVVIGAARFIIILSLYLLFEQISHSSRIAAAAVVLYMANSNFMYWSAQFSYESLSLPLGVFVIYILAKQGSTKDRQVRYGLTITLLLLIGAIIVTHHVTSYAVVFFLILLSIVYSLWQLYFKRKQPNTWVLGFLAGALTLSWLIFVASSTTIYLSQIFQPAIASVWQLITGSHATRALFTSSGGTVSPLWERAIGIISVILILVGCLAGLIALWIRKKLSPFILILTMAALVYFVALGFRFTGAGWEIANRTSEFLFIGIAFLIAFGFVTLQLIFPKNRLLPFVFTGYIAIVIAGGLIIGWPPALRLSKPFQVAVNGTILRPEGLEAASWMLDTHGPGNRIIAPTSDALLMLAYGKQEAMSGKIFAIQELFTTQHTLEWQSDIIQEVKAGFVETDQRKISWDGMLGSYFSPSTYMPADESKFFPYKIFNILNVPKSIPRVFDSGNIVIFDVGAIRDASKKK